MSHREQVRLAGSVLDRSRHVCAFFLHKEKEYRYDGALCCIYDLTRFGANIVMNSLRTHSMLIIGGVLQENPFFVPPDEFLRELRERTGQSSRGGG